MRDHLQVACPLNESHATILRGRGGMGQLVASLHMNYVVLVLKRTFDKKKLATRDDKTVSVV